MGLVTWKSTGLRVFQAQGSAQWALVVLRLTVRGPGFCVNFRVLVDAELA